MFDKKGGMNMAYSFYVKKKLFETIAEIAQDPKPYCYNPEKDFTRKRKLDFQEMLSLIIKMEGKSIKKEMFKYFNYSKDTVTSSAFVQQRSKIKPNVFRELLCNFTDSFPVNKLYKGYRVIACDGSNLITLSNPKDEKYHFNYLKNAKPFNKSHINALYDVLNCTYIDAIVEPGYASNERKALMAMMSRYTKDIPSIVIADRGYEAVNLYAFFEENGFKYVVRAKENNVISMLKKCKLDYKHDFDYTFDLQLINSRRKSILGQTTKYKYVDKRFFDYLNEEGFYPIKFRVIRILLGENSYEYIFTNLAKEEFSVAEIKELYNIRWGIEVGFRDLKYTLGLVNLHSIKAKHIEQEIFAKMVMYNFCQIITLNTIIQNQKGKYSYKINFSMSVNICRQFLWCRENKAPPDVETLILKELLPVRSNRKYPRKMRSKPAVNFIYRIA